MVIKIVIERNKKTPSRKKDNQKRFFKYWRDRPINYFVQMQHYKLWKNIWLVLFVVFIGISEIVNLKNHWTLQDNLVEIISIKLAIVALFGTLFASANKNYRIYANLYDQTKF